MMRVEVDTNGGREHLSVKLDGPGFPRLIFASLVAVEGGDGYVLIWSRRDPALRQRWDLVMTNQRKIYRTPAAAERIGVSVSTMEKWRCASTGLLFVKIGRRAFGYWGSPYDFLRTSRTSTAQTA
jgi:Protein of unknown function (DUF736)